MSMRRLLYPLLKVCLLAMLAGAPRVEATPAEDKVTDPVPLLEFRTPGQVGWFWTLSQAEADSAANQYSFTRLPTKLGFLRRQPFAGSQPLYRLRVATKSAYLLTASETERSQLLASGSFVEGGVLGYVASTQQPGTQLLYRMSNNFEWRVVPASMQPSFAARGYRTDGPLGYVWPVYYRTGAVYFATFDGQGNLAAKERVRLHYGQARADGNWWWAGVADLAGIDVPRSPATYWTNEDFSDLKPAIGYYDDSQPETLRKHIVQASSAGLRYFSFYWYWNPSTQTEKYVQGLKAFLQASNRANMDFNVTLCVHPWMDGNASLAIPYEQIATAANTIVNNYLTQPNYLRANDGRPIVGVCDARGIGQDPSTGVADKPIDTVATKQLTDAIRARARALLNEEILIVFNGVAPSSTGMDGSMCLGQFDRNVPTYQQYVNNQRNEFSKLPGTLIRCATSGFDERPRIKVMIDDPGPDLQAQQSAFRWYPDADLPKFAQLMANVRADIDASTRVSPVDNFVQIYAWNEWHEGGYIEPNMRDGCAYLNTVRQQLSLPGGTGCVAQP
ncbi:MAG TPA: glycoside hydrolase family 99-like domain-containing protein [Myxococcaceae bacterium]